MKLRRTWLLTFAASTLTFFACRGAHPSEPAAATAPSSARSSAGAVLDRPMLEARAARLQTDVNWLADDAQEGRRAGTEAGLRAGEWIASKLQELGLEPLGDADRFLQAFEVPLPVQVGTASGVGLVARLSKDETIDTAVSADGEAIALFCSGGGEATGGLAFRGYGLVNSEKEWDDYAGAAGELEGRVVLVVRGTPPAEVAPSKPVEDEHGAVEPGDGWGSSGALFMKVMNAKRHGAVAVVVAPHPSKRDEPLPPFDHTRAAQAGIPAIAVTFDVATRLLPAYEALVANIDRNGHSALLLDEIRAPGVRVKADVVRAKGPAYNVLARLRGRDSSRAVLVGAHYDHLGYGGDGSLAPDAQGQVHNGADDNASGTAAVIEMARRLAAGAKPACDVVFALWSGEELGLLGSEHWAQHPTLPLEHVVANLNLDMVGRAESGALAVLGVGSAEPFETWLAAAGPRAGFELKINRSGQGVGGSDHQTFLKRQIPSLHFFTGVHADYHKPSDDADKFDAQGAARVVVLCVEMIERIAQSPRLAWVDPPKSDEGQERTGGRFSVWFGTVPEYSYEGQGLMLSGTSAGSPAEKAGMLTGDVLLQVGDIQIETIHDFVFALQTYKAGDVVLAKFLRDGVVESARVTLATRDAQ